MDIKDYVEIIKSQGEEIDLLMRGRLPVKIRRMQRIISKRISVKVVL